MGFKSWFGTELAPQNFSAPPDDLYADNIIDYGTTRNLFKQFESVMDRTIIYWQSIRQHYAQDAGYKVLSRDELDSVAGLLFIDPSIDWSGETVIDLSPIEA